MKRNSLVIGDENDPSVTHLMRHQILSTFGIDKKTFERWRLLRGFPEPVALFGFTFYARADIEKWRKAPPAPRWLRGIVEKPTGLPPREQHAAA
jgi:hypothetical protein